MSTRRKLLRGVTPVIVSMVVISALTTIAVCIAEPTTQQGPIKPTVLQECFAPTQDCQPMIVHALDSAEHEVYVCAYVLTDTGIINALISAHARGVEVTVVLDAQQAASKFSGKDALAKAGIPVYIDHKHRIMHNKVMVIDWCTLITGSYNFTNSARKYNAENLLIEESPELCVLYLANIKEHISHSVRYTPISNSGEIKK